MRGRASVRAGCRCCSPIAPGGGGECTDARERSRRRVPSSCSLPSPGCEGLGEELSSASRRAGGAPPARGCSAGRRLQLLGVIRRNLHCHPSPVSPPPPACCPAAPCCKIAEVLGCSFRQGMGWGGDKTIWGRSRLQTPSPSPGLPDPRPLQPSSPLPCHSPAERCSPGSGNRCSSE